MERIEELEAQFARFPQTAEEWSVAMRDPIRREALANVTGPWAAAHDLLALVEQTTPHPPGTAEDVRQWLLDVVRQRTAAGPTEGRGRVLVLPEPSADTLAWRAGEADRLSRHIFELTHVQLRATEPLPYRRTLSKPE